MQDQKHPRILVLLGDLYLLDIFWPFVGGFLSKSKHPSTQAQVSKTESAKRLTKSILSSLGAKELIGNLGMEYLGWLGGFSF